MKKGMLRALFVLALLAGLTPLMLPGVARASIDEGIEYQKVTPPVPTTVNNKQIEVVEMFWYGCPHCYHFEPSLLKWLAHKPKYVVFTRIPAIFNNPMWEIHAKAYYTADVLGVLDKTHEAFFNAIHEKGERLATESAIEAFFVKHGVSAKDFKNAFNSFAVYSKVRRAAELTRRYGIDGVPSMIVDGKYRTSGSLAGGNEGMIKVINFLVAKEAKAKGLH